jgi:microsomal dipeptidase-like Zn-dependent dipeptidase
MRCKTLALLGALAAGLGSPALGQEQPFTAAVSGSANTVTITWTAVSGATAYTLVRTPDTTVSPTVLTPTPISTRTFTDVLPTTAATYYYRVATTLLRQRLMTPWVQYAVPATLARPLPTAPAPANLQPVTGLALSNPLPNGVTLSWGAAPTAVGYHVYRRTSTAQVQRTASPITALSFTDRDALDPRLTYTYTVSAIDAAGLAADASITFTPPPPQDPSGFTATPQGADVVLRWKPVAGALHYLLAGTNLGTGINVADTTFTVRNVTAGGTWTIATAYAPAGAILTQATSWPKATVAVAVTAIQQPTATATPMADPRVFGFADLHVHQFNNLSYGGSAFWGSPFGPIDQVLVPCDRVHGPGGLYDIVGAAMGQGYGHPVGGSPSYDGWPRWNTFTHQQVYVDWLKRAYDGGLRLMVMQTSNNPFLCTLFRTVSMLATVVNPVPNMVIPRTCDDTEAIENSIAGAKLLEADIDLRAGGRGKGWYRIVYSPQEARDAIAKGQLAVVLGIEAPTPFGCYEFNTAGCTRAHVAASVQRVYDLGIRQITPVHSMDNAFGGTGLYNRLFSTANLFTAGHTFDKRDCTSEGVTFTLEGVAGGHCNPRGLTPLGDFYIRSLMNRGMLVDIDHMSRLTRESAFQIAEQYTYPVLTSHSWLFDISVGQHRAEPHLTKRDLQRIRALGGVVALITETGGRNDVVTVSRIPNDCGHSSQTFAQAYFHAVKELGGAPVAFGTDFNGFAGQPAPRFGPEACGNKEHGLIEQGPKAQIGGPMLYPFAVQGAAGRTLGKSRIGTKDFDYNVDGLAHIGMLPDLIQDLKTMGVTDAELEPLFRSAEGYIQMWERAVARSASVPPPPIPVLATTAATTSGPPQLTITLTPGASTRSAATVTVTVKDARTGEVKNGTVAILSGGTTTASGATGAAITYPFCYQPEADKRLRQRTRVGCQGTVGVPGYASSWFVTAAS